MYYVYIRNDCRHIYNRFCYKYIIYNYSNKMLIKWKKITLHQTASTVSKLIKKQYYLISIIT